MSKDPALHSNILKAHVQHNTVSAHVCNKSDEKHAKHDQTHDRVHIHTYRNHPANILDIHNKDKHFPCNKYQHNLEHSSPFTQNTHSTYTCQNHIAWCQFTKSASSGVNTTSPPLAVTNHSNGINGLGGSHPNQHIRVVQPPSGVVGELRPRPADSKCTHAGKIRVHIRNTNRGFRSITSIERRSIKRSFLRAEARRLYRSKHTSMLTISPPGQDTTPMHKGRNKKKAKIAKKIISKTVAHANYDLDRIWEQFEQDGYDKDEIDVWQDFFEKYRHVSITKLSKFIVAQINMRGLSTAEKRNTVDKWGADNNVDFLTFEETKVNSNCVKHTENYVWFFSSKVKNEDRDKANKLRESNKPLGQELTNLTAERRGVGIAIKKNLISSVTAVKPISDRLMYISVKSNIDMYIIAAYAPTADSHDSDKEAFYVTFEETYKNIPNHNVKIIGGDLNAKIIWMEEDGVQEQCIGKHYLKADDATINNVANTTLDNRNRFLNFVTENDLVICNTRFQKQNRQLCTHLPIGHVITGNNWDYHNLNQIDYILINKRRSNGCKNAESDTHCKLDSDHFPVWAEFRFRFKKPSIKREKKQKILKISEEAKTTFAKEFNKSFDEAKPGETGNTYTIDDAFWNAKQTLADRDNKIKKDWISNETYELIKQKQQMEKTETPLLEIK